MTKNEHIPKIALLISTSRGWGRRIVKGILNYANEVGPWHVWVNPGGPDRYDHLPADWDGDGIIGRISSPTLAEEINQLGLPVINVADTALPNFSAPCVRTDDRIATQIAAAHFVDRGFRNIAFVGPTFNTNPAWYLESFKSSLAEHGRTCHAFPWDNEKQNLEETLIPWLKKLPKPTGLLVWGQGVGRSVVDYCMAAGIPVPHDLAILSGGYDELLCHACFPSLSGILPPTEQIGYKAAQLLHAKLKGEVIPDQTIYLPPLGIKEHLSTDTLAVEDPQLVQVVQFLRQHAFEQITMEHVLQEVPMARRSLERRFHQVFGRSPIDEIRRLRIDKARHLLAETDLPMQQIAEACGYATYNYLTHVFKRVTHTTPRDYRKKMRIC